VTQDYEEMIKSGIQYQEDSKYLSAMMVEFAASAEQIKK